MPNEFNEPWRFGPPLNGESFLYGKDCMDVLISSHEGKFDLDNPQVLRMIDCVNACAGLNVEFLQTLIEDVRELAEMCTKTETHSLEGLDFLTGGSVEFGGTLEELAYNYRKLTYPKETRNAHRRSPQPNPRPSDPPQGEDVPQRFKDVEPGVRFNRSRYRKDSDNR